MGVGSLGSSDITIELIGYPTMQYKYFVMVSLIIILSSGMDSRYSEITDKKNLCLKVERSGEQASAGRFKCALEAIHLTQCSLITLHSDDQPLLHNTMLFRFDSSLKCR